LAPNSVSVPHPLSDTEQTDIAVIIPSGRILAAYATGAVYFFFFILILWGIKVTIHTPSARQAGDIRPPHPIGEKRRKIHFFLCSIHN
jgi:hypothetical protein